MHQALAIAPYSAGYCSFVDEAGSVETSDIFERDRWRWLWRSGASMVFVWAAAVFCRGLLQWCWRVWFLCGLLELRFLELHAVSPSTADLAAAGRGSRDTCFALWSRLQCHPLWRSLLPRAGGPALLALSPSLAVHCCRGPRAPRSSQWSGVHLPSPGAIAGEELVFAA